MERDAEGRLDYFHGQLTLSPNHQRIANDGWAWHPLGIVQAWSVGDWLSTKPFESEDGPSKKNLCQLEYLWDTAVCWLNDNELAVWGQGFDEEEMLPAALIYDTDSGEQKHWFYGPEIGDGGWFGFDTYLFAVSPQSGTTVWDVESGERLHLAPDFKPNLLHQGEFLTWGESITLSRLRRT